jgi:hypothetical protein
MLAPRQRTGHLVDMKGERKAPDSIETPHGARPKEPAAAGKKKIPESGGPAGPEPTRYGDWERGGRCVDF